MSSSLLEKELAHLHEQIERVSRNRDSLKDQLRLIEAELEKVSAEQQRFDAVRAVCAALDTLAELKGHDLFWEGAADDRQVAKLVERAKGRFARFEGERNGLLEQQASLKQQINACLDELTLLDYDVRDAYDREARREKEYVVEREVSPIPDRSVVMPGSREAESERYFRKALLVAVLCALFLGTLIPLLNVPEPVRPIVVVVPERLVSMLKKEPPKPEPPKEEKKHEKEKDEKAPKEELPKPTAPEVQAARKKAENTGVLAFKDSLKDLIDEDPASRLGAQAHLSNQPVAARSGRSLVALPSSVAGAGSSGGISGSGVSRDIDPSKGDRIASVGFTRVESKIAAQTEEARPVSSGPGPVRTDEEIQIVFDKYKAALYRMYNTELRRNPTLRGRIIMRITIEPGGEVSACTVQSNDLRSPELVDQIMERVKKFNFGPKDKVSKTTILYPIDFLPGG